MRFLAIVRCLISKTYESTKTVSFQYNATGGITTITDQNGTEIDQGFDDLDRLTARDITLGSGVGGDTAEEFAYDALVLASLRVARPHDVLAVRDLPTRA